MPNPSEMQREMEEEYERMLAIAYDLNIGKTGRQAALTEVRRLGRELGINTKPYNGHPDQ